MVRDSLRYLVSNTDISYVSQGSVAKALLEASNLEVSRLQDFAASILDNTFLSTASGVYLDLFGEMLNLPRITDRIAQVSADDGAVRFYVDSGTLGSRLRLGTSNQALIPVGTTVSNAEGTVTFRVTADQTFPINARSVFVTVKADASGTGYNVGANQLTVHSLSASDVKVTNDIAITTGTDIESDAEYRYRLSKAMTTKFGGNTTAIKLAASSRPGVSRVELVPFARGAGTFDVLLIPQGNRVTQSTIDDTRRAIENIVAYGISPKIREPNYVRISISVQLTYLNGTADGQKLAARSSAESAILRYLSTIPLGGEIIVNQIRASVLSSDPNIRDLKIVQMCIDGNPRVIRNIQLERDEVVIPDENSTNAIEVL